MFVCVKFLLLIGGCAAQMAWCGGRVAMAWPVASCVCPRVCVVRVPCVCVLAGICRIPRRPACRFAGVRLTSLVFGTVHATYNRQFTS